jgi:acyl carrier protein
MTIEEKIRDFIFKSLYFVEDETLESDTSFLEQGIIDSRGAMELVTYVETEFGIEVKMADVVVENFDSIQKLAGFVRRKLATRESAHRNCVNPN